MDVLRRTYQQFLDLLGTMSPSQRGTLVAVTATVVAALGLLVYSGGSSTTYVPLSVGKLFTVEEIIRAEEALLQANLDDFKREGQRLLVPRDKVLEYNSALVATGALPQNWAEEWEKQFSNLSAISNPREMEERKEMARAKLASEMVRAIPGIESANVIWDHHKSRRFGQQSKSTATVFVQPKRGQELNASLANSIRHSIAGIKADLAPEDVTVTDLGTGFAHRSEQENNPFNSDVIQRIRQLKEEYRREIHAALDYIKGVKVAVNVDIEKVKASVRQSQKLDPKGSVALISKNRSTTRSSNQAPTRNEPGVQSNQPQSIRQNQGIQKTDQNELTETDELALPSYTVTQEQLIGAMPSGVQVSIQIPEDYYRAVAIQTSGLSAEATKEDIDAATEQVRAEIDQKITQSITPAVPQLSEDVAKKVVTVSSFVAIAEPEVTTSVPVTETISVLISQWGSAVALAFFGLWALWMLNSSMKKAADSIPPPPPLQPASETEDDDEQDHISIPPPDTRNRDSLQYLVRDNPEMAASIISKWIREES